MPAQGYLIGAALVVNLGRSLVGGPTICSFARRHPVATAFVLVGGNAWLIPHLYGRRRESAEV